MATPNLERLVGFHVPLTHSFDRLSHALSTRRGLKQKVWLLDERNEDSGEEEEAARGPYYHEAYDPTERFLSLNSNHDALSTLVLHQDEDQPSSHLGFRAIIGTLQSNPHVRHLALSGLSASAFTNLTLNTLPVGLLSLRLENLRGINDKGMLRFLNSPRASCVRKLSLVNIPLKSLPTISAIFSNSLSDLESFTIAQDRTPTLAPRIAVPDFRSSQLQYLHWEFRSEAGPPPALPSSYNSNASEQPCFPFKTSEPISCLATSLLAASIRDGTFPSLRNIRIPHDPQGLIQNLCKPLAATLTPYELASLASSTRISRSNGFSIEVQNIPFHAKVDRILVTAHRRSSARADSVTASSSTTATSSDQHALSPLRSRVAAHCRILAARKEEAMIIQVADPDGNVCASNVIGGYMGDIASRIDYVLDPDRGRVVKSGESGSEWLTGVRDLVGETQTLDVQRASCRHAVGSTVGRHALSVMDLF
ncbi:hypothetical protein NX059_006378 [Plenodomus lindquistii]|nr:hypothetical protein NX059_006378 [Plenodomus lindquistii]